MPNRPTTLLIFLSLGLSAAIFGFFYAWVCSTMWGLDAADPRVAIGAMQAMNASVLNAVFAPAFFATPFVLAAAAYALGKQGFGHSARLFALSAAVYFCFGMLLTMFANVPMNEALAIQTVPTEITTAREVWRAYSPDWQVWNQLRTIASGLSFLIAIAGVFALIPQRVRP